jgi:predicted RNA-binding Zn-ribbon protein involved in translation (DUF1610 family)
MERLRSGSFAYCKCCGYEGFVYGTLIGDKVCHPWCPSCGKNNMLVAGQTAIREVDMWKCDKCGNLFIWEHEYRKHILGHDIEFVEKAVVLGFRDQDSCAAWDRIKRLLEDMEMKR